jgi:hypothetical protein
VVAYGGVGKPSWHGGGGVGIQFTSARKTERGAIAGGDIGCINWVVYEWLGKSFASRPEGSYAEIAMLGTQWQRR